MKRIDQLSVKIFADGADLPDIVDLAQYPYIKGFTTNPTLMRKAGVRDYRAFARDALRAVPDRPISFEVLSDEFETMKREALEIACWGELVYVKIPVTNTRGEPARDLIAELSRSGVKINVTAVLTIDQVRDMTAALAGGAPACISMFAGRIADTGCDPVPVFAAAVKAIRAAPNAELIWASPRELLNIFHAESVGCHIITLTHDILKKLPLVGYDLTAYSLDTVKMFVNDAVQAGFAI